MHPGVVNLHMFAGLLHKVAVQEMTNGESEQKPHPASR